MISFNWPTEGAIQAIVTKFRIILLDIKPPTALTWSANWRKYRSCIGQLLTVTTVMARDYREMISNFFFAQKARAWLAWHVISTRRCHTARVIMDLLKSELDEHFISPSGPVNWPPRLCDLTPLDYSLWDYVKLHVYRQISFNWCIGRQMLDRICQNWTKRMDHLKRSLCQHLPEIIFKH